MFNKFSRKILPDVTISKLIQYVISQSVDPKISVLTRGLISHARYSKLMYLSLWFTKVFQGGGETNLDVYKPPLAKNGEGMYFIYRHTH